jgi:hypothetical protein
VGAWRRLQVNRISSPPTNRTHNQDPVLDPKALRQISHHHGIGKIVEQKTLEGLPLPAIYNICVKTRLPVTKRDIINTQIGMVIRLGTLWFPPHTGFADETGR